MARPTVMTKSVINKLEEAFALGCTDLEASLYANIAPATLYNHQDKNPEFLERKDQLKMSPILKARKTVVGSLDNPDIAMKYLERKKKDEFSTRVDNDITTFGKQLPAPILAGFSIDTAKYIRRLDDEQVEEVIKRGEQAKADKPA